ncbi:MAG: AMP-binding protein [Microscillaceae bacterium]|jgi:acetyl-CoA synthetase|nr:AMP-binding protein [Microscillaceae bacterium]
MKDWFIKFRQIAETGNYTELHNWQIEKPTHFNWVSEVFEGINLVEHPDKTALILAHDSGKEEHYTYQTLANLGNQLLNTWRKAEIKAGSKVFVMVPICAELWITYLATIKGGLVLIPTATIMSVKDLEYRFQRLFPEVVVSDQENAHKIEQTEQFLGKNIPFKLLIDGERPGWHSFQSIDNQPITAEAELTRADDNLFLFFTSGTTGMPKIVAHTHLSYPFGHLSTAAWLGIRPSDIHFNISQPGWAKYAWSSFFAPFNVGATIFCFKQAGKFTAIPHLQALQKYQITTFCAPPTVLRMLILEDLLAYQFVLRECVSAGEPLNPEVIAVWQNGTGIIIRDGYGQTESTAMIYNLPAAPIRFGSMGKPSFLYEIAIVNDEGEEQTTHAEGHIAVRMNEGKVNGIFKEYFGEPSRRQEVVKNGWYYTGDKAYKDEDGYIWFVGRDDDVIKASDYRVGPFEVESALIDFPHVVESAVVGSPHPIKGFEVKAFIVLSQDAQPTDTLAQEIFLFCRKNLAAYKTPRIIEFVDELPKTISGKIRRVELRAQEVRNKAQQIPGEWEYFYNELVKG